MRQVEGSSVTWRLVESFQNRQLIRVSYTQQVKYGGFYVPVSDGATLKRLKGKLADYLKLSDGSTGPSKSRPPRAKSVGSESQRLFAGGDLHGPRPEERSA